MASVLRRYLAAHRLASPWRDGLVCGRTTDAPFAPATSTNRARKRWLAAGLSAMTLHECRHTFASLMIAANVNAHALKTYIGHSTVAFSVRPVGAPDAGQRGRGGGAARRLSRVKSGEP
jgi:integrase